MTQHPFRTQRFLSLITFAAALCLSTVASAAGRWAPAPIKPPAK